MSSFIKWAGGKNQLLPDIMSLLPDMKKITGYAEPFIGGGSVFFFLKEKGYLDKIPVYLSDTNIDLINTYKVLRSQWKELTPYLTTLENHHCEEQYYKIRNNYPSKNSNNIERAAQFIYLNKTCFNGQIRVNSDGRYNMGMGDKIEKSIFDIDTLHNCSVLLQNTNIGVMSFENIIKIPNLRDHFIYCDPPYDIIEGQNNFIGYQADKFEKKRHFLLPIFKKLDELGCKVMMSNSYSQTIIYEFKDYNINTVKAKRMINSKGDERGEINEVIITNYIPAYKQTGLADFD